MHRECEKLGVNRGPESVRLRGRFLCSTEKEKEEGEKEEEEGIILPLTQTELKRSELLAMADGGRNERQMEKSLPTCLSSSRSACVCV